jgi:hypothetical protein
MTVELTRPVPTVTIVETSEVDDLVAGLRPRLAGVVPDGDVDRVVREAVAELGPVRVTTYLPILVERRVRQRARSAQVTVAPEVRVTA